ncbi:16S rRNA (guanine(527)-N(7))-methyltransferase RsmG [Novosphingobium aquimarinum]|uniref:16S rRNA (guanine(527)-N(7))-methyltransferase RsmG n=1 Tax=Novosphingobium aquimarinum TaxID=2682494 RepID=UPI0012EB8CCD|nr:16S rRNA (guanine(527)-N(7))-methyltransferase RsmG [Novosphingobium aquimarinum]
MKCDADTLAALQQIPEFDDKARARLVQFAEAVRDENRAQNLIAASSLDQIWSRHFLDSAQLLHHVPRGTGPWLDLGSGAGFPGLVAAILRPECDVRLVESRRRRIEWLERASVRLGLDNITVIGSRLEAAEGFTAGVISARAFAPLPKLLDISARFSTIETIWLLPKGRSAAQELDDLRGWRHTFHVEQSLTDPDAGIIVGTLAGKKVARA